MTAFLMALSLLLPLTAGTALFKLLVGSRSTSLPLVLRGMICLGLGLGFTSCFHFLTLWLIGPRAWPLSEAVSLALAGVVLAKKTYGKPLSSSLDRSHVVVLLGLAPAAAYIGGIFIIQLMNHPHGDWDAWAIWNLRARYLVRGGTQWIDGFSPVTSWSHPDYPLLLASLVARGWTFIGVETPAIPGMLAFLFTAGTLALLMAGIAYLRGSAYAFVGGALLLANSSFAFRGAYQMADIPLSFFFLLTMVLLALVEKNPRNKTGLLVLSGAAAGFSAWTKNEGFLFLLAVPVVRCIFRSGPKAISVALRETCFFFLGALPVVAVICSFKWFLAPTNDILFAQDFSMALQRTLEPHRYVQISSAFYRDLIGFGETAINPLIIVLLWAGVAGVAGVKVSRFMATILRHWGVLCVMMAGYFLVYLTTPFDLTWHVDMSLFRLFLQLWPIFIFAFSQSLGDLFPSLAADKHLGVRRVLNGTETGDT